MTPKEAIRAINEPVILSSRYGDVEYILRACILRRRTDNDQYYYQAELQDPAHGNCLVYAGLEDVKEVQ